VVLNSAERAPYLLILEILHGDLDFDATKRNNKDILRKMVVKESERKGTSQNIVAFDVTLTPNTFDADNDHATSLPPEDVNGVDTSLGTVPMIQPLPIISPVSPPTPPISPLEPADNLNEEEEMDLVEQLYGTDESLLARPIDLSESIVLPAVPKNRDLDLVTWSRSGPPSPFLSNVPVEQSIRGGKPPVPSSSSLLGGDALSLDDYSERMRTAAVMLAQLNANMSRELVPPTNSSPDTASSGSSRSWLPGSSWLGSTSSSTSSSAEQPYPTGRSTSHLSIEQQHPGALSPRLKLQYSEAAAIRNRIMKEMMALEEERMERMRENREWGGQGFVKLSTSASLNSVEDESIIRKELNKVDPSAVVFSESWATKKVCTTSSLRDTGTAHTRFFNQEPNTPRVTIRLFRYLLFN
jgi:phosphatidylinositol 4-kinase B